MSWAESAAPDASPTCRTGPQDSYATAIVGSVGLIQTLTARSTQSTRSDAAMQRAYYLAQPRSPVRIADEWGASKVALLLKR